MEKTIWFDMDGTIADLYGVENWLEKIIALNPSPYTEARPLLNLRSLARVLNRLRKNGYKIGIVSWLSKTSTTDYDELVTRAKKNWLRVHLGSVEFDRVDILPYGIPKEIGRDGILFDDEKPNRDRWTGTAYDVENILEVLRSL